MKPNVLAKIVAQVSVYFQKAFEQSQVNKNVRTFDQGKFAAVLGYQAKYFIALAYNLQAEEEYKVANEKSKGIGKAITVLKITVDKYIEAQFFVTALGGAYKVNFDKKYGDLCALRDKAVNENKTIYYEQEVDPTTIPKPDAQSFVKLAQVDDEVNSPPDLDNHFRKIVTLPLEVQEMMAELKNNFQAIITD